MLSMKEFGELIAKKRKELGYTQEALANKLEITPQAISKWENGIGYPDISLFPALADVFGMSIDELFGRENAVLQGEVIEDAEAPETSETKEKSSDNDSDKLTIDLSFLKNIGKDFADSFKGINWADKFKGINRDDSNHEMSAENMQCEGFTSIYARLCNACNAKIIKSDRCEVKAWGTKKFIDSLSIDAADGKLSVIMQSYNAHNENDNNIEIYVDFDRGEMLDLTTSGAVDLEIEPDFDVASISVSGAGDIVANDFGQISAVLSGAADMQIKNACDAKITASGAADIEIGCVTGSFEARMSGAGDLDAESIHNGYIQISGAGDADIGEVSGSLTVILSGSSDTTVSGSVEKLNVALSGSSTFDGKKLTAVDAELSANGPSEIIIGRVIGNTKEKIDRVSELRIYQRG